MSGYTAVSAVGRVTPGEQDTIWTPRTPRTGTCGLILLPGSGNPRSYMDNIIQPASFKLAAAMAGVGIPTITCDFGGNSWANDATMTAITNAWTTLKAAFPAMRTDKVCLLGGSMGGGAVARWSQLNPSSTACVVGLIPAFDLRYEFENIPGIAPAFRTAWGMGGADPFPATADNAANYAAAAGIPLLAGYASNDTTVPPAPIVAYAQSVGGTAINLGALGHTDAAIGAMPHDTVAQFLVAHGA
jgi:hypothetical protein